MSDSTFLLLQHIDCEPGAAYEDVLAERRVGCLPRRAEGGEPTGLRARLEGGELTITQTCALLVGRLT